VSEHPTSDHTEVPLQRPEDDEFYNGSAVEVMSVPAGTTLWRFVELDPPYDVSTFNPNISPHHEHPTGAELGQQGRFDPLDHAHGGYVYCSPTLGGAVAEGILRAKKVPASRIIPAVQVDGRALVRWQLHVDLDVAALHDPHLQKIGLSSSIHSCRRRDYGWSRRVADAILSRSPHLHGLAYPCRNDTHSTALLLVQRPHGPLTEPGAYSLVDMRARSATPPCATTSHAPSSSTPASYWANPTPRTKNKRPGRVHRCHHPWDQCSTTRRSRRPIVPRSREARSGRSSSVTLSTVAARIDHPSHANGLRTDSDLDEGSVRNPRSSPRSSFHSRRTRRMIRGQVERRRSTALRVLPGHACT